MRAAWRAKAMDPGTVLDAGLAACGAGLTALALWGPPALTGTTVAGPSWLLALLPLIMGAPLLLRRRAPLLMWGAIWAGTLLQTLITGSPPLGFEIAVVFAACYALGAHSSLRRSVLGLALSAPVVAVCLVASRQYRGAVPGTSFLVIGVVAFWLTGVFVHSRRQAASLAARNAALERQAEEAAAAERARIARELHDIVAHHLSVMVLQAGGARASGKAADAALAKIEHSGRQALAETRRLLGVLRAADENEEARLAPQPGLSELPALADTVRGAGLQVSLAVHGGHEGLPAAVGVSAYRIVQEALTNVLKHAGPARADVTVGCADGAVMIEVTDDGAGTPAGAPHAGGQGLAGMRERVAIFGGELQAGPRPGGGFAVRARLPLGDGPPLGDRLPLGEELPPSRGLPPADGTPLRNAVPLGDGVS